jgi:SAM-dependent methyltransferase
MPFESRFGECANAFQRYRPDYPPALYLRIFSEIVEADRNCAMDLGAGTGIVTGHLSSQFQEVIAVEPDAAMAAKITSRFPLVTIRQTTAEECAQPSETVDLITIGNALHWMNADRVFENVLKWLRKSRIAAIFDRPLPKASSAVDAITMAEFRGPWKPYRDARLKRDLNWKAQARAASGFCIVEETRFPNLVSMTSADYVGFWRSTSYGSAYARTLPEPEKYWIELENRFTAAAAETTICVDFSSTLIVLRKT